MATDIDITTTTGVINTGISGPYANLYIHRDTTPTNSFYQYYNVTSTSNSYIPDTDVFKLADSINTGSQNYSDISGILTDDNTLNFDFQTHGITVENTNNPSPITAGFAYRSNTAFSGTLLATGASATTEYEVTADGGNAYGFIFSNNYGISPTHLDRAAINLAGSKIIVSNSGDGLVSGFSVGNLTNSSTITLGDISATTASGNNEVYGFSSGDINNSNVVIGDITATTTAATGNNRVYGFSSGNIDNSNVEIGDIQVTSNAEAFGFKATKITGTVNLNGNITAATTGFKAYGIYAEQLNSLDVTTTISATGTGYEFYGIYTQPTNSTDNSTINIKDGASIYATATGIASVASIKMDSTGNDIVNIAAGNSTTAWTNNTQAFTLLGVETLNITGVADLSGTNSLRGRTSNTANGVANTNVTAGSLKVKDSFFNSGTGTSEINVTSGGTLELVNTDTTAFQNQGSVNKLTVDGGTVTMKQNTDLEFVGTPANNTISVKNNGTLKIEDNVYVYTTAQKSQYSLSTGDFVTNQLGLTIENSTIEVEDTVSSGTFLQAYGLKTTVVGNATINVASATDIYIGDITTTASANVVKTGDGTLTLNHNPNSTGRKWSATFNLNGGNLEIQEGTVKVEDQSTSGTTPYDMFADVDVAAGAIFENAGTGGNGEVKINALSGAGTVTLTNAANSLDVQSGNFAGQITGNGTLKKTTTAGILTLTNDTPFATNNKVNIVAGTLKLDRSAHTGNYTFDQNLTGNGTLEVGLNATNTKFSLGSNVGTAFIGTIALTKGTIELDGTNANNNNDDMLTNVTLLKLAVNSVADIKSDTTIGNLTTNGGTVKFATTTNKILPDTLLTVGILDVSGGATIDIDTAATTEIPNDLLDSGFQKRIIASNNVTGTSANVTLSAAASATQTQNIKNGATIIGTVKFNYTPTLVDTGANQGVSLSYDVTEISANSTYTIELDATGVAAPSLSAKLTGGGNFKFTGDNTQNVTIGNASSDYTGTTEVTGTNFTVTATSNNAFGNTSNLTVDTGATVNFDNYSQTVKGLDGDGTIITNNVLTVNYTDTVTPLAFAGTLSGTGSLTKDGAGELTLSGTTNYTGATTINNGTLALDGNTSLATSSGVTINNGTFDVSDVTTTNTTIQALNGSTNGIVDLGAKELIVGQGSFAGTITGTGTLIKNTAGTLTLTNDSPFAATNNIKINEGTLFLDRSSKSDIEYTFEQELIGNNLGTLEIELNDTDTKFSFDSSVGNNFTGTVALTKGTIELNGSDSNNYNDDGLARATLQLAANSIADVQSDTTIKHLTTNNGTIKFHTTEITPNAMLTVSNLDVSGGVTIDLSDGIAQKIDTTTPGNQNIFDYANDSQNYQQQLILATGNVTAGTVTLNPNFPSAKQTRILQNSARDVATITFDYNAGVEDGTGTLSKGVYLGYGLTEIHVNDDETVELDATGSKGKLYAKLTGDGSFNFTGSNGQNITVGNAASDYNQATEITGTNFTVKAASDNAFGNTSELKVDNSATVNFNNYSQTVGALAGDGKITNGKLTVDTELTGSAVDSTFAGTLEGAGSLTKNGNGILTLSNTNTYNGATNINGGTLELTDSGFIDNTSEINVAANGTLEVHDDKKLNNLNSAGNVTFDGNLTLAGNKDTTINGLNGNNGSVTKTGSGTTTLSGTNTYTGATIINNGILALTGNSSLEKSSAVTINSGTFDLSGVTTNTKVQDLQGSGNVELGNKNLSVGKGDFSGTINGNNGTLTKTGNDKLTLSGTNTYTGETNINGGMLALKDSGSIASSSKLTLANNTIFDLNEVTTSTSVQNLQGSGNVELGNKNLSVDKGDFNGTISGNDGTLTKTGIDTLTLSGTNIYTGETNIEDGTLALKNSGSIASSSKLTLANNSIFNISGISATSTNVQNLQGSGSVELGNKNISIDKGNFYGVINGTGTLTKTGIDTLTFSGTNTYSGATNINAGTLELFGSIDNTTEINVAAGTILKTQDTKKLNNLNSTGTVTFDNDLELAGNKDTTINGLNGTKNVAKTGTGKTTLGNNNVGTFVQKNGSGKVLLTGTLTGNYNQETSARTFVANAGNGNIATIDGNASFDSNVELENKLKITGNLELGNNATINIDFTKTYNVTGSVVDVDGTAAIAGNTNLNIEYWEPGTPKTYRLFTANQNVTGTFKSANVTFDNNAANNRQGFEIITTPDKKQLNLVTFTKNLDVTRTSGGKWSDPKWEFSETNKFCNGDYVTISTNNNDKNWELNVDIENGVETAGMKIENGNWTFSGNKIIGKEQTGNGAVTLINNDGQLNVTGKDTAATFKNAVKFEDINVTNNAKLHLPDDSPVETGTLKTESGTELSLKAVENKVTANGDVVLNGDVQFDYQITDPTKTETIKNVITTTNGTISGDFIAKVSNDKLLATTGAQLVGNNKLNFVYNPSSVNDFAKSHKLSGNMAQIGDLIDSQNYADSELLQQLYNLDPNDKEKFVQILFNQLGPELAANALQLSLWQPYEKVFNRLHEINESQSNNIQNNKVRGQLKERLNYELWFEGFYRGENVTHDNAAGDYKTTRGGLLTGVELQLDQTMRTGFFFSYSNPYVSSNIGRVEADDIVFGSYSHLQFGCNTALNASIAYGNQNYKYQHNYNRNNYNGDAMYASIELFRSAFWRNNWQLVPLFAVDFQKAWMKGFTTADTNQVVAKSTLGQTVLRIGLNSKFQPTDHIHFRTRLQYGIQVGGEVFSSVRTSYLNNPNQSRILTGVNLGRNMLNVGIGTDIYLSRTKRFRLFANYDFDFGERSTAHTGQFGFLTTW